MKKIINGKKYDTETATFIFTLTNWDCSVSYEQVEHFYKKKTGEFFRYDQKKTNWGNIHEYETIIPLTIGEAQRQLENYMSVAKYESIFGEVEE